MKKRTLFSWLAMAGLALGLMAFGSETETSVHAQEAKAEAKAKVSPTIQDAALVVVPFSYQGLLFCDVTVNGSKEKFNFLIDSGASQSILSLRVAERLGITMTDAPTQAGGVGKQDLKLASNVKMTVQGETFIPKICGVLDTSHVNDKSEIKLEGILGADWMASFKKLHFNFKTSQLELTKYAPGNEPAGMGEKIKDIRKTLEGMMGGKLPPAIEKMVEAIEKAMGGAAAPSEEEQDFDDDGVQAVIEGPEFAALPKLQQDMLRFAFTQMRTIMSAKSPLAGANEDAKEKNAAKSGIEKEIEAEAAKRFAGDASLQANTIAFDNINMDLMGMKLKAADWWIIDCSFDGKPTKMVFDTGASSLAVLDKSYADTLDVGHSLGVTVSGVGSSEATFGLLSSYTVGDVKTKGDQAAIILDLKEAFSQLEMIPGGTVPTGLLGLPYALRYREMIVDNTTLKISFVPYTEAEIESGDVVNPHESNVMISKAVKSVWAGTAGSTGFKGEPLNIIDWPNESETGGVVITKVRKGSSAEKNGLEAGDLVLAMVDNDEDAASEQMPIADYDSLKLYAAYTGMGKKWSLLVKKKRTGKKIVQEFELGAVKSSKLKTPKRFK